MKRLKFGFGLICLLLTAVSCASKSVQPEIVHQTSESTPAIRAQPKVGIILGPGGWKAFAHIGVLHELENSKIPIHAIVGVEMGAVVGGLYAQSASANFVEWTLGKLKPEDLKKIKLFSKNSGQSHYPALRSVVKEASKVPIQSSKIPFGCPSLNLNTGKAIIAKSGTLEEVLDICLPLSPIFPPDSEVLAGATDIAGAAQWLRAQGAELVILVNPLAMGDVLRPGAAISDRLYWYEIKNSIGLQFRDVDFVIGVHTRGYEITAFDARKSFITFGAQSGKIAAQKLRERYGF